MAEPAPFPVRPIDKERFPELAELDEEAFNFTRTEPLEKYPTLGVFEFDRSLGAFDGDRLVGSAAARSLRMTVPGGVRPIAGVTWVGVLPTYRRRGILTSLMRRQLDDLHEHGEAVAALFASESSIYGRFGYGCAARHQSYRIRRGEARMVPAAPRDPTLRVRSVPPREAYAELAQVYDPLVGGRPGMFERSPAWWDVRLHDPEPERSRSGPLRCVVVEDDIGPRGYGLFRAKEHWDDDVLPAHRLRVEEAMATDPAAFTAVWAHLLDRDLVDAVEVAGRPMDDPLLHLLADPRRLRARAVDNLWVRLVDVDRAFAQRVYSRPLDLVIEVDDPVCPWNSGRWRLSGDETGGACTRTGEPPEVTLPAAVLGAAYLGRAELAGAVAAGLVREVRTGAVAVLSAALSFDPLPWCPMDF